MAKFSNHLIQEKSPYLKQHAHNPVDWFPWGNEAFKLAKEENKPIFLSIGYSTCHWCHVMEKESFEDQKLASRMNEAFVNIKVDREELPEVDGIYMDFAKALSGQIGWPLNVILTPDLVPFFASTYLPLQSTTETPGMLEVIDRIESLWKSEDKLMLHDKGSEIIKLFQEQEEISSIESKGVPDKTLLDQAVEFIYLSADTVHGGLNQEPKFPLPYHHLLMIRYGAKYSDNRAVFFVNLSLKKMAQGGIYDHIGGGFCRYAVDRYWQIPHFEKMAMDNLSLASVYMEAYQLTHDRLFKSIALDTLDYLIREMLSDSGCLCSAQDADSNGIEGYFYTWAKEEIYNVLGEKDAPLFCDVFNVTEMGNFNGRSVLYLTQPLEELAEKYHIDSAVFETKIGYDSTKLFEARNARSVLFRDDKILTNLNGLGIGIFAEASVNLEMPSYLKIAETCAHFLFTHLWHERQLYRRWIEGEHKYSAILEDYTYLIHGLIKLFEVAGNTKWLKWAMQLTQYVIENFQSETHPFYSTDGKDPSLILRRYDLNDGIKPSGNAIFSEALVKLYQLTGSHEYLDYACNIFKGVKERMSSIPFTCCYHFISFLRFLDSNLPCITIALNEQEENLDAYKKEIFNHYIPHKTVMWFKAHEEELITLVPRLKNMPAIDGKTTVYITDKHQKTTTLTDLKELNNVLKTL